MFQEEVPIKEPGANGRYTFTVFAENGNHDPYQHQQIRQKSM